MEIDMNGGFIMKRFTRYLLAIIVLFLAPAPAPAKDEIPAPAPETVKTESVTVNINTATASELTKLKGIGKVKAQRIIDYRVEALRMMKQRGIKGDVFKAALDLTSVKGIGEKTVEKNLRLIILK